MEAFIQQRKDSKKYIMVDANLATVWLSAPRTGHHPTKISHFILNPQTNNS
jgi:hypothetical protein